MPNSEKILFYVRLWFQASAFMLPGLRIIIAEDMKSTLNDMRADLDTVELLEALREPVMLYYSRGYPREIIR